MGVSLALFQIVNCITFSVLVLRRNTSIGLAWWFLILNTILIEIVACEYFRITYQNNIAPYNLFMILGLVAYYWIYSKYLIKEGVSRKRLQLLIMIWGLSVTISVFRSGIDEVLMMPYVIGLLVASVLALWSMLAISRKQNIIKIPEFWLSLGVLIFTSCSLPMLLNAKFLIISGAANKAYWHLLKAGNVILSLSYLMAILCHPKKI